MRVAHFSLWAPYRSGLFEFVIDQIKYERRAGIDSLFIHSDVENPDPNRFQERGIVADTWEKAKTADVWVLHRSIPAKLYKDLRSKKAIAILHGTSEIMALHDIESRGDTDKFNMHVDFINTYKKVVCITKSDYDIMKLYDPSNKKLVYINDAVDTEVYNVEGYPWNFRYRPAILSTSNVRINKNPCFLFWAMPEIIRRIPKARLNVFGLNIAEIQPWRRIVLKAPQISSAIENLHHQFYNLKPFQRGADISFNSNYNGIFSRDSMEAMAAGCSIIAYTGEHTPYVCERRIESIAATVEKAWADMSNDPEGQIAKNRAYAVENFSMEKAVVKYIELYNSL